AGRSGRARTCDPRFWRPVLYQLSYTPTNPASPRVRAAFKHRGRPDCKGEAQGERLFMPRLLGHSSSSTSTAPPETSRTANPAPPPRIPQKAPPLPEATPETLGLPRPRLQAMSDAFKREIDKGTVPGVTVLVARRGQVGWFEALGRQNPATSASMTRD